MSGVTVSSASGATPGLRSEEFVRAARADMAQLHSDLVTLMREVELTEVAREGAGKVIAAKPTLGQRHATMALLGRFRDWFDRIRPFLGRSPTAPSDEFDEAFALLSSYFALRRVASDVSDEVWREMFEIESAQVVMHQLALLDQARECFALLDPRQRKRVHTLTIRLSPLVDPSFRVVAESCYGHAEGELELPFDARDLENFILRHCDPARGSVRGWRPPTVQPYADFGAMLFAALFNGDVRDLYMKHMAEMRAGEVALRIRLGLDRAPGLADLPWEYLYDGTDFVALTGAVSVTRHIDADRPVRPLRIDGPLRVAVTVSAPTDQTAIDATEEVSGVRTALAPLVAAGLVRIDVAPNGTIGTLAAMFRAAEAADNPFHVWHFIGHGRYLPREGGTYLAFESANGTSQMQSGFELGMLLSAHPSLRLAVLNACEGARSAPEDSLTSVGAALVARGLPAAIAMQFSITDEAAIRFAEDFYRTLADDGCVDTAVGDARRGIFFMPNESEWATPVIISRAEEDVLFKMA